MDQITTHTAEELMGLRERMRLARDHMTRAQQEFESALTQLGPNIASWFFCLPDACECGVTPTVSVLDIYEWFTSLTHRCQTLYQDLDESTKDAKVKLGKRGSKRGNYLDLGGGHIEAFPIPDLPKITPAPKEDEC